MPSFNRQEFFQFIGRLPEFMPLQAKLGPGIAPNLIGMWFDETMRFTDAHGDWSPGGAARLVIVDSGARINVRSGDHKDFVQSMKALCIQEDFTITNRQKHVQGLLARAVSGALRAELDRNVEPPATYFHAPAHFHQVGHMRYERVAAPARDMAAAWLVRGVAGDAGAFREVLDRYVTHDGRMPLDEGKVRDIWKTLTRGDARMPRYRPTLIGAQLYPSEVGGAYLLKYVFRVTQGVALPPPGSVKWEDWALFYFGSIMAVQGFTDGNKRTARAVYAILVVSAGLAFLAPTNAFGAALAKMVA